MADSILIVEDGSCPAGANTYASLAQADAYCIPRGLWTASEEPDVLASREQALIRATDWLDGLDWRGSKVDAGREKAWPRRDVYVQGERLPEDAVPASVRTACIEAAAVSMQGTDLLAVQDYAGPVTSRSAEVGPVKESYAYGGRGASVVPSRPALTARIAYLLRSLPEEGGAAGARIQTVGRA